jgi:plasmid stabilization system protein ParE
VTEPYVLTRGAGADLRDITRYTVEQWGAAQCRRYIHLLEAAATDVACGQGHFKSWNDVLPGLRVRKAEHHYIFCLPRSEEPALILAILHERTDMLVRLRERLTE